jgi:signal peptidase
MSTSVLDKPALRPAPAADLRWPAEGEGSCDPAPSRSRLAIGAGLIVKAAFGVVLLGLLTLTVGPRFYPFQGFYVRTSSMSPTIAVGALVIATRAPARELGVGDVIVFERPDRPGTMVVHRIFAIEETPTGRFFVTKGDANASPDSWQVPASGNGWRARYVVSRAGFAVAWLHIALSRRGWLAALSIITAVCALISIWTSEEP